MVNSSSFAITMKNYYFNVSIKMYNKVLSIQLKKLISNNIKIYPKHKRIDYNL